MQSTYRIKRSVKTPATSLKVQDANSSETILLTYIANRLAAYVMDKDVTSGTLTVNKIFFKIAQVTRRHKQCTKNAFEHGLKFESCHFSFFWFPDVVIISNVSDLFVTLLMSAAKRSPELYWVFESTEKSWLERLTLWLRDCGNIYDR